MQEATIKESPFLPKRLVLFADGTWNDPGQTDDGLPCATNVVKLSNAVLPQDAGGAVQIVYYHTGVGERGGAWDHFTGGAFGVGISKNIEDLYLFLIGNYAPGDEVWLFGFSRGAYTVRSLAGLIRNCGILRRGQISKYKAAYELYRDRTEHSTPKSKKASDFRAAYSWPDFDLHFIGVWDTVGALGIPVTPLRFWTKKLYEFHDTNLSSHVRYAYQAVAIDERRKPFLPALWKKQPDSPASQILEQAWFPGVHCDVGGGYAESGLSDGALAWLWEKAHAAGLALDGATKPVPDSAGEMHDSMTIFYRMLGDGGRTLGRSNPLGHEVVGETALSRMSAPLGYRPENLAAFLKKSPASDRRRP
ncbi:MAG TPA: hypothetical protein DEB40_01340 [Elusimicrobia bacterium]|nr:hypothetical protein [Elusimicrobiota bacterium]HBT60374.1 hypothetical protein [Elusimicrobiota bacterium]